MPGKIELHFSTDREIALDRVKFSHPLLEKERVSVRGKFGGAYGNAFSFQWTPAVQALTILLLRSKCFQDTESCNVFSGEAASPAASLDYAIGKQPAWLLDMFGLDSGGNALIRRLVHRTNPERKRGGRCAISLNPKQLSTDQIQIFINGELIYSDLQLHKLVGTIESTWVGIKRRGQRSKATEADFPATKQQLSISRESGAFRLMVLPVISDSKSDRSYSLDLTNKVICALSNIGSIEVIAGHMLGAYKDLIKTPVSLASQLGCIGVILGSRTRCGNRYEVTLYFVSAESGVVLWSVSHSFSRSEVRAAHKKILAGLNTAVSKLCRASEPSKKSESIRLRDAA